MSLSGLFAVPIKAVVAVLAFVVTLLTALVNRGKAIAVDLTHLGLKHVAGLVTDIDTVISTLIVDIDDIVTDLKVQPSSKTTNPAAPTAPAAKEAAK